MLLLMALMHFGESDVLLVRTVASCKVSSACAAVSKEAAAMLRKRYMRLLNECENERILTTGCVDNGRMALTRPKSSHVGRDMSNFVVSHKIFKAMLCRSHRNKLEILCLIGA